MRERLSKTVTLREATASQIATRNGIQNVPSQQALSFMIDVSVNIIDPIRERFNNVIISSFFRSTAVNKLAKGSRTSQHPKGQAVDLDNNEGLNDEIFNFIRKNLEFDQLIWEFGDATEPAWVHVSFVKGKNRKQVLRARRVNGRAVYEPF